MRRVKQYTIKMVYNERMHLMRKVLADLQLIKEEVCSSAQTHVASSIHYLQKAMDEDGIDLL